MMTKTPPASAKTTEKQKVNVYVIMSAPRTSVLSNCIFFGMISTTTVAPHLALALSVLHFQMYFIRLFITSYSLKLHHNLWTRQDVSLFSNLLRASSHFAPATDLQIFAFSDKHPACTALVIRLRTSIMEPHYKTLFF